MIKRGKNTSKASKTIRHCHRKHQVDLTTSKQIESNHFNSFNTFLLNGSNINVLESLSQSPATNLIVNHWTDLKTLRARHQR